MSDSQTSAKIIFGLYDLTAREDGTFLPFESHPFSSLDNFVNNSGESRKIAVLEEDQILTDGKFSPFPESGMDFGLWSTALSGKDKMFPAPVVLDIRFQEQLHSSIGLTLHFDRILNDYPGETEIRWYDENDTLIDFKIFLPDKTPYFFNHSVSDYKRIQFLFYGTNKPYRYLKLNGIEFGIVASKEGDEIISATVHEKSSPISDTLEISTLNCEFRSKDTDFSMLSAKGIYEYLQERQRIEAIEIRDGEEIPMGTYYVDSWDDGTTESVKLYAVDALGVIDKTEYAGGIYTKEPAGIIIKDIMKSANMPYTLDPILGQIPLSGHLPISSHRQALQQVCMAVGGMVDTSRDSLIKIKPMPTQADYYIPVGRKFLGQTPSVYPLTTGVEVTAHNFVKRTDVNEIVKEEYDEGAYTLQFNQPTHNLSISGGQILWQTVNAVSFAVDSKREVTITGSIYEDVKQSVYVELKKKPASSAPEVKRIEKATLVSMDNAEDVAQRILEYYMNRHTIKSKIIVDFERVASIGVVENAGENSLRGYIESLNIDLAKGYIGEMVLNGSPVPISYSYYTTEIYTGEDIGVI